MMTPAFPKRTATIYMHGFPREGLLCEDHIRAEDGEALYYFPGDFIVGDGFELWLDAATASDSETLQEYVIGS